MAESPASTGSKPQRFRLPAAAAVLIILGLSSVLAPFLANDRPIWYHGINHAEYRDAYQALLILLQRDSEPDAAFDAGLIARQTQRLGYHLSAHERDHLDELVEQSRSSSRALDELRSGFAPGSATLKPRSRWPVWASLTLSDRLALAALVGVLLVGASQLHRQPARGRTFKAASAGLTGAAIVAALIGGSGISSDRTDYAVDPTSTPNGVASVEYSVALWPPIASRYDTTHLTDAFTAPRLAHTPVAGVAQDAYWLGTDELGRDLLARLVWGGRVTLLVGLLGVVAAFLIGVPIGAAGGYFRGSTDLVASRFIELFECLPGILVVLALVTFFEPGLITIIVAIAATSWPSAARLTRAEFLRLRELDFVVAAEALGCSPLRVMARHILPNALNPLLVTATFGVASAMLTESAVSFLGFGVTIPTPSWGGILASGREAMLRAPWLIICPGLGIFATVISIHSLGEILRARLDPWGRNRTNDAPVEAP